MELEVVSTFARLFVTGTGNLVFIVAVFDYLLIRRRRFAPFLITACAVYYTKNLLIAYLMEVYWDDELMKRAVQFLFVFVYAAAYWVMACYTYEGSVLKIGLLQCVIEMNLDALYSLGADSLECFGRQGRSDFMDYAPVFL